MERKSGDSPTEFHIVKSDKAPSGAELPKGIPVNLYRVNRDLYEADLRAVLGKRKL